MGVTPWCARLPGSQVSLATWCIACCAACHQRATALPLLPAHELLAAHALRLNRVLHPFPHPVSAVPARQRRRMELSNAVAAASYQMLSYFKIMTPSAQSDILISLAGSMENLRAHTAILVSG